MAVLLMVAGWFLLVSPQRLHAARLREQGAELQTGNAALRAELALRQAEARDLPLGRAKSEELRRRVPGEPQLPELLGYLTSAATNAGVELVAVTPQPPAPLDSAQPIARAPANLQQIPLTVEVRGGYVELAALLDQVESLPRAVLVTSISLAAEQAEPGRPPGENGRIDMTITARTFVRARDPLLPTPPQAPPPPARPTRTPSPSATPSDTPSATTGRTPTTSPTAPAPAPSAGSAAGPTSPAPSPTSSATAPSPGTPGLPPGTSPSTAFSIPRSPSG